MITKASLFFLYLLCINTVVHAQSTLAPPEVKVPDAELPKVRSTVSTPPEAQFPGGYAALQKYISTRFEFDSVAVDEDYLITHSRVYLQFDICTDGSITNVTVRRGISTRIDQYCIRFIEAMPNWIPARDQNGNAVKSTISFPIIICLD